MSDNSTGTKDLTPHFEEVQAHYDLSDDFFGVFQDPTRKYSCAYFTGPNATLSQAQIANVDQHLDRLEANKDAAIAATDEENYHRYMRYLKGCQYYFIDESIDVSLVTYLKPGAAA